MTPFLWGQFMEFFILMSRPDSIFGWTVLLSSPWLMFTFFRPHGLQHSRLPCPSPSPRACSDSCPLSQWCHPTVSSVVPFSSCLQSFRSSGSFLMGWFLRIRWQSIGASASVLPVTVQDWFPLGLTGLILQLDINRF